jgi:hypothetical protein
MPSFEIVIYLEITQFFKKIETNESDFPIFVPFSTSKLVKRK